MTPYYARATAAVGVDLAGGRCGAGSIEEIVAASDRGLRVRHGA
jgi:hypothetical protein